MSRYYKLKTKDGKIFELEDRAAKRMGLIGELVQLMGPPSEEEVLPLLNVNSEEFEYINVWIQRHLYDPPYIQPEEILRVTDLELPTWDRVYFENIPNHTLFDVARACSYLQLDDMANFIAKYLANIIRRFGKIDTKRRLDIESYRKKREFPIDESSDENPSKRPLLESWDENPAKRPLLEFLGENPGQIQFLELMDDNPAEMPFLGLLNKNPAEIPFLE